MRVTIVTRFAAMAIEPERDFDMYKTLLAALTATALSIGAAAAAPAASAEPLDAATLERKERRVLRADRW